MVSGILWQGKPSVALKTFHFSSFSRLTFAPDTVSMITAHYTFIENIKIMIITTIVIMIMLPFETD